MNLQSVVKILAVLYFFRNPDHTNLYTALNISVMMQGLQSMEMLFPLRGTPNSDWRNVRSTLCENSVKDQK